MSVYVAAYDISHPGRRQRVAQILQDYGRRVQKSVFEVWLEGPDLSELCCRVGPLLGREDRFDLFPLDLREPSRRIGWQQTPNQWEPVRLL